MWINQSSTVERAFELAKSGQFRIPHEIQERLRSEGYTDALGHFSSPTLKADLRRFIALARLER
jgi:hypothetical protein